MQPSEYAAFIGNDKLAYIDRNNILVVSQLKKNRTEEDGTKDHKPGAANEKARIEAAGGKVEKDPHGTEREFGLAVSRALGDFAYK